MIPRLRLFLAGLLCGVLLCTLVLILLLRTLASLLVVHNEPGPADAIVVISGGDYVGRLRKGLELYVAQPQVGLVLVSGDEGVWQKGAAKLRADGRLPEQAVELHGSLDTRTDAQLSLQHCREKNYRRVLVVTAPYHTRRTQLVFADIYAGSGIKPIVVSSGDFGRFVSPEGTWWNDRKTLETVWLELGKILYWELTPFEEYVGEGTRLKTGEGSR